MIRSALDRLYFASAVAACIFFACIAVLVVLQVVSRLVGLHVAGLVDYATYSMVASTFLGLGYALKRGSHIRVTLVLFSVSARKRRVMEVASLAIATALLSYFAWFAIGLAYDSWRFGLREMGLAATPLWIPQSAMALGAVIAAIAFADELIAVLRGGAPTYAAAEREGVLAGGPVERARAENAQPLADEAPREAGSWTR
jgi:TRAP-type C4-dicarboxylate transport system permease small subunit